MLFSGCGNKDYRDVELTDFEYKVDIVKTDTYFQVTHIRYVRLTPLADIDDLTVYYKVTMEPREDIGYLEDSGQLDFGTVKKDRVYTKLIEDISVEISGWFYNADDLEIISATGKVKK